MDRTRTTERTIAAIIVDVQGDFTELKTGALAVPGTGADYVMEVEEATRRLRDEGFLIIATQDWHPPDHASFYSNHPGRKPGEVVQIGGKTQILWPPHCVQDTENARVLIDETLINHGIRKGQDPRFDSYSAFQDEGGRETDLDRILQKNDVKKTVVFGLATDYCVKSAVLDGLQRGYRVVVIEGLSRGITPESTARAIAEMEREGAVILKDLDIAKIRGL